MGLTGGTQALRRRLAVCLLLLGGIFVAGLMMPTPDQHPSKVASGAVAAPTPSTSTTVPVGSGATAPTTPATVPFAPPPPGAPTPTVPPVAPTTTTPSPPVVPITPPTPQTCGSPIRKAGGGSWTCTFDDEFDGSSVDLTKWRVQETSWNGFHSGSECFEDRPANVNVSDGALHLTVRKEQYGFTCNAPHKPYGTQYTSGMLTSFGKFTQAYGRFEMRAKMPAATIKGLQTSFWLWPQDPYRYGTVWPSSGEIDVAEAYSRYPDRVIPYLHYLGTGDDITNNSCLVSDLGDWHTYTVEWTTSAITILYDGKVCIQDHWSPLFPLQHPAPFDQPFMVSITQALGIDSNAFDPATTPLPATTTVDYVRVWK